MKPTFLAISCVAAFGAYMLIGCVVAPASDQAALTATAQQNHPNLPNPASVNCEKNGYRLEIRTAPDGSQSAACIFPDGSECDEWAYFRGECGPGTPAPITENKAVEAAKVVLGRLLNVDTSQIAVFSLEQIQWPDSCLAIPGPGEVCNPVETPGFRVIFRVGEDYFTYHTDLSGENLRQETAGTHGG